MIPRIVPRIVWKLGRSSGTSCQHLSISDSMSGGQSFGATSGLNGGFSDADTLLTIFEIRDNEKIKSRLEGQ